MQLVGQGIGKLPRFLWGVFYALVLCFATPAIADDVTLRALDGEFEISGTLLTFDGSVYRIATDVGALTVDAARVDCVGPACPNMITFVPRVNISMNKGLFEPVFAPLLSAFASGLGAEVITGEATLATVQTATLVAQDGAKPLVHFHFYEEETVKGLESLAAYQADFVVGQRALSDTEISTLSEAGVADFSKSTWARLIAKDAIVPVLSPDAPVQAITLDNLGQIAKGNIDNWSDLGGPDTPILVHHWADESDLALQFKQSFGVPRLVGRAHDTDQAIINAILNDPYSIGFTRLSQVGAARVPQLAGKCGREITINAKAIKRDIYPHFVPLVFYRPARQTAPIVQDFVEFLLSDGAQEVLGQTSFVSQELGATQIEAMGDLLLNALEQSTSDPALTQDLAQVLRGKDNLSLVFRFKEGTTRLDLSSQGDLDMLLHAIKNGRFDGRKLYFLGFSDGRGSAEFNLSLSQKRANAVIAALVTELSPEDVRKLEFEALGFAAMMPILCDDTKAEREVNRRVEIWVE